MRSSIDLVRRAFRHQGRGCPARGELWVGSDVLHKAGLKDDPAGHLELRKTLGMDILFLPVSTTRSPNPTQGYRYFEADDLDQAVRISDLFVGAVVDGPFQRLAMKKGLMTMMTFWGSDRESFAKELDDEASIATGLIAESLGLKVGAVVIADDLAWEEGTYIHPDRLSELLGRFYAEAAAMIRAAGAQALFHSCGNITAMLPKLKACGFDGLAAVQIRRLDPARFMKEYGSDFTIMAGIEADLLETESPTPAQRREFALGLRTLSGRGGLILCSSCGLFSADFLDRLPEIYRMADEVMDRGPAEA